MYAKMSGCDWKLRVTDILACIPNIRLYVAGMTYEEFREDAKTVDAVIRNFEIIGEAAGYNPEDIQERFPESAMAPPLIWKPVLR